ncbi:oligosaccharide flippase family protein [Planococcus sp. APC 3906]|uniref:lipopolysaccharide biosynthesis protein n=1 Tax=Planococcus sp. APC 3906 TaxID=3035194 RepID=UPI0025B3C573|nr:oligosaccharide flippase family protein [Planococcus sp. APC 3906]MDN3450103.1 oligosaccharide flippase family protein [Planococcus sp. APC 3906]
MLGKLRSFGKNNYFISASLLYVLGTVLLQGISFLTTPIFTRIMDTSDYGITAVFATWVTFIAVFISFQVSSSIASARIHMKEEEFTNYLRNITLLTVVSGTLIMSGGLLFASSLAGLLSIKEKLIPHLMLQSYGTSLSTLYGMYLIHTKQPKTKIIFAGIVSISLVMLGLLLVFSMNDDRYLGRIWAGSIVNLFIIAFVLYTFLYNKKNAKFKLADWSFCLKLSWPLIIHLVATTIIGQSSRLFIVKFIGETEAAIFTVAFSIGIIGMLIADAFNNAWSPWYLDNTKNGQKQQVNEYAKRYSMVISSGFVMIMLLTPELLRFMAPEPYWNGKYSVLLIAIGVFFQFLYRFPLGYEQFNKNMKWVAFCTIVAAVLNLGLNYLLVPLMGIEGAAIAILLSYIVLFLLHEFVARVIIGGYNIRFSTYIPATSVALLAFFLSYLTMDYFYFRLMVASGYATLFIFTAYRIWSGGTVPKLIKDRNGAR